jgi:threonyl-tRNA synthetase
MTADELIAAVKEETEGMPFRRLPLPRNVAERINFK